jgi:hypothetical protein
MKRTPFKIPAIVAIFAVMFLTSCFPGDEVSYADLDLVATVYDKSEDFQALGTFVMPDTIVHIKDTLDENNNEDLSRLYDNLILTQIKQNMLDYGYVEETNPVINPPDAVLTVSAMATTTYYAWSYYPYYWGWYGGWYWYKSSDYYYPWYPYYPYGGTYVSSYTQGSLIMSLSDVSSATEETDSIPVVWLGVINGLMGSTDKADIQNRLEYGIDQAFDQSLYLKQN